MTYQLRAISGDCGPHGMSAKADIIKLDGTQFAQALDYINAQTIWLNLDIDHPEFGAAARSFNDIQLSMLDMGIFEHKWHARTTWILERIN